MVSEPPFSRCLFKPLFPVRTVFFFRLSVLFVSNNTPNACCGCFVVRDGNCKGCLAENRKFCEETKSATATTRLHPPVSFSVREIHAHHSLHAPHAPDQQLCATLDPCPPVYITCCVPRRNGLLLAGAPWLLCVRHTRSLLKAIPAPPPHQITALRFIYLLFSLSPKKKKMSTNLDNLVRPIDNILDGSNYMLWSPNMEVFLRGRRLWRYVCGEIVAPTQKEGESDDKFANWFDDWDSANYRIISWFINTSVPSIHSLLPKLGIAKAAWEFWQSGTIAFMMPH